MESPPGRNPISLLKLSLQTPRESILPAHCWMVRVPPVNVISDHDALQLLFGHPASDGDGSAGTFVVTVNGAVPFFT